MKFLVDECLSPKLAEVARERGYDASHVSWIGMQCWKDWELKRIILDGDWTFVTKTAMISADHATIQATEGNMPM